jgi:cell division protein FtsB
MGNRGGAPSWVYKNQMNSQASDYQYQISLLRRRIQELESENAELKEKIRLLENKI